MQDAIPKTSEQSSLLSQGNPFNALANLNPANQPTEVVIEACLMIGTSFKEFFGTYSKWLFELKKRMEVRPGSKGKQLKFPVKNTNGEVHAPELYWHEFLNIHFKVSRRYIQSLEKNLLEGTFRDPNLLKGDVVTFPKDGKTLEGTVAKVHQSADKVDVTIGEANETVPLEAVSKVNPPTVKKIKVGDLILCDDSGAEFKYEGHGKFSRTKMPTLLEQRDRELATIKANRDREAAKAAEKVRQKELRKAEAARRDLEKIAEKERHNSEAKAKKEAARLKKAEAEAAKVKKRSKRNSSSVAQKPAQTELVKMVRIGDTREFGVYPESCMEFTLTNALAIGARQLCETERDRINAERRAKNGSTEGLPETTNALAPSAARPSNSAFATNVDGA